MSVFPITARKRRSRRGSVAQSDRSPSECQLVRGYQTLHNTRHGTDTRSSYRRGVIIRCPADPGAALTCYRAGFPAGPLRYDHHPRSTSIYQLCSDHCFSGSTKIFEWSLKIYQRLCLPPEPVEQSRSSQEDMPAALAGAFECSALAVIAATIREPWPPTPSSLCGRELLLDALIQYLRHPGAGFYCANRIWFEDLDLLFKHISGPNEPRRQLFPQAQALQLVNAYAQKTRHTWTDFLIT